MRKPCFWETATSLAVPGGYLCPVKMASSFCHLEVRFEPGLAKSSDTLSSLRLWSPDRENCAFKCFQFLLRILLSRTLFPTVVSSPVTRTLFHKFIL